MERAGGVHGVGGITGNGSDGGDVNNNRGVGDRTYLRSHSEWNRGLGDERL